MFKIKWRNDLYYFLIYLVAGFILFFGGVVKIIPCFSLGSKYQKYCSLNPAFTIFSKEPSYYIGSSFDTFYFYFYVFILPLIVTILLVFYFKRKYKKRE